MKKIDEITRRKIAADPRICPWCDDKLATPEDPEPGKRRVYHRHCGDERRKLQMAAWFRDRTAEQREDYNRARRERYREDPALRERIRANVAKRKALDPEGFAERSRERQRRYYRRHREERAAMRRRNAWLYYWRKKFEEAGPYADA